MTLKIHNDIDQNSIDWLNLRAGRITGSQIGKVMANYPKAFGPPAKAYASDLALERITGNPVLTGFHNDQMARGHEQEPVARQLYEEQTFSEVEQVGFISVGDYIGCSPDGLVDDDGMTEFKSRVPNVHFEFIRKGTIDAMARWQCIFNMHFSGRAWCDYASYCEQYPEGHQLSIKRLYLNDYADDVEKLLTRLSDFEGLIGECNDIIRSAA